MSDSPPLRGLVPFAARDLVQRCNRVITRVESSRAKEHERKIQELVDGERRRWCWRMPFGLPWGWETYHITRDEAEAEYGRPDEEGRGYHWTSRWWTDRAHDNRAASYHVLLTAAENVDPLVTIWVNVDLATELH